MPDERDPEATLEQWKSEMQAEHEDAIANPDPTEDHRIEGVAQVTHRVYFRFDADAETLVRDRTEQVDELSDPELRSCSCGVRGMSPKEALEHIQAGREAGE